jgi:hypothetical protein
VSAPDAPPAPPADLDGRTPLVVELAPGARLHRFYKLAYAPIFYDPDKGGRLNAPDASYGVLYAAKAANGAFAETFLRSPGRRLLDPTEVAERGRVVLRARRVLKLIDFTGRGLPILGATAEVIHGGKPYDNAQGWSKALRAHPSKPDGIAYTARHDPSEVCYALFEAADPPVEEVSRDTDLDSNWFWEVADHYEVGLAPT